MKKTLRSVMTAAMFAAAATAATGALSAASENHQAKVLAAVLEKQTVFTTTATLYGPPPADDTTTFTTTIDEEFFETDTTLGTDPPLYGPPSVLFEHGDVNMDFQFDARDLTLLKQNLLRYQEFLENHPDPSYGLNDFLWDWRLLDVNNDEAFDIEDVRELRRLLTGKTKEQEDRENASSESWPGPEFHVILRIVPFFTEEADQLSDAERAERVAKAEENLRNMTCFKVSWISGGKFLTGEDELKLELSEHEFGMTFDIPVENICETIPEGTTAVSGELRLESFGISLGDEREQCLMEMKYYQYVSPEGSILTGNYYDKVYVEYDISKRHFRYCNSLKQDEDVPEYAYTLP